MPNRRLPCRKCGGPKPPGKKFLCDKCPWDSATTRTKRNYRKDPEKRRAYSRQWRLDNLEKSKANARKYHHANPEIKLWRLAKARAKKQGLAFTIEKSDVVIPGKCPVLGIPIFKDGSRHGFNDNSPTLDRWDNAKGYVAGNVHVISWRANRIKCDATADELLHIAHYALHGVPK